MKVNGSDSNFFVRTWNRALPARWWGSMAMRGYSHTYSISKIVHTIFLSFENLNVLASLEIRAIAGDLLTKLGFGTGIMIPFYLYQTVGSAADSKYPLKTRVFNVLSNVGHLGVSVGALLRSISNIWQVTIPLQWLPPFQFISATVSTLFVGAEIIELRKLQQLRAALDTKKGKFTISAESASRFLGIPKHRYQEFVQILKDEPNHGDYLKARLDAKIKNQKLKIAAGIISLVALVILVGFSFTPAAPATLALGFTIGVYFLMAASTTLSATASIRKLRASNPLKYSTTGKLAKLHPKVLSAPLKAKKASLFGKVQSLYPQAVPVAA